MKIEVFADNLKKTDVKYHPIQSGIKLIALFSEKVLLVNRDQKGVVVFPGEAIQADETETACLARWMGDLNLPVTLPKKTVTVSEYFSNQTYIHHYYVIDVMDKQAQLLEKMLLHSFWADQADALKLFEGYEGNDEFGQNKMERDFIALMNSI